MRKEHNAIIIKPGDIIKMDIGNDRIRQWRVTSVCLGSARQEHLIGIETIDKLPGVVGKNVINEMFVPSNFIELAICNENRIVSTPLDVQIRTTWIGNEKKQIECLD